MLQEKTIAIIKATVPVLEVHGEAITRRFYERLFEAHPELLNVFNINNQRQGRQQAALANAVYAAAVHIEKLDTIIPVVKQIGAKHRSLGVLPAHYPIVGEHLLGAMRDVLQENATDEIISAWAEAYGIIAQAFIDVEKELYEAAAEQPGGWEGLRSFRITRRIKESDVIDSFYLEPLDQKSIAAFQPGQYLTLQLKAPGVDYAQMRHYSLSDSPNKSYYRISVKREDERDTTPGGLISRYIHSLSVGDTVEVAAPAGEFIIPENTQPLTLLSGGVGMTPFMSYMNTAADQASERHIVWIHAALNGDVHAFAEESEQLAERLTHLTKRVVYERPTDRDERDKQFYAKGYITADVLREAGFHPEGLFFICGPEPFMRAMYHLLTKLGVKQENITFEFFGPASSIEAQAIAN